MTQHIDFDTVVDAIVGTYADTTGLKPLPSESDVVLVIADLRRLLFYDFVCRGKMPRDVRDDVREVVRKVYDRLTRQCGVSERQAGDFLGQIPNIRRRLMRDADVFISNDPACDSAEEVVLSYPGFLAITVYRLAHALHQLRVLLLPRMLAEWAHSETGIDIHPGAQIGEYFFIDHGTGIVIGETTVIGNRVSIYQGVTLGAVSPKEAVSKRKGKRHPTIEDDVIIYANATILGGGTIVGRGAIIGGNAWVRSSVPEGTVQR